MAGKSLDEADTAILVESPVNAMSAACVHPEAACIGLSNAAGGKVKHIREKLKNKKVVCFFDADQAGDRAALDAAAALNRADVLTVKWPPETPEAYDVNDLLKLGKRQEISEMIQNAEVIDLDTAKAAVKEKQPAQTTGQDAINEKICQINKSYAAVMSGSSFCIMKEDFDVALERHDIHLLKTSDFHNWFANDKVEVSKGEKTEQISISKLWFTSPLRRQFKGIVFAPGKEWPGYYNLYRGLAIKPIQGKWNLLENHLYDIICGGNNQLFQWVYCWLARIVQDPGGKRPGTSIVLRGKQGCGKGTLMSAFGPIFGRHYLPVTKKQRIFGNFNSLLKDAIVVFLDESFWGGDKQEVGILKTLITEEENTIEHKNKDAFLVKSHVNLIMASNNDWCVPAGIEERRFCVMDVSEKHIGDREYFNRINKQLDNGGREAMLYDLLHTDISSIDLRTIPRTDALVDQILETMDTVEIFWSTCLYTGIICQHHMNYWKDDDFFPVSIIHNAYLDFCHEHNKKHPKAFREFKTKLKSISNEAIIFKRQNDQSNCHQKIQTVRLPALNVARKTFEKAIGKKMDWGDKDDDDGGYSDD
ncbi:MAG: DUF5906 domain-containing protein [Desulfosalsimonadaceae bacterium]